MDNQDNDIISFALTNFRNQQRRFGIKLDDRRRHMYLIGKTGMGKTTVLENMMIQDVRQGHGLAVIDPHGDFVEKILDFIPPNRINDVVYINPADFDYPVAFNVLESVNPTHQHLIASGLIAVFKKMWIDSWGPRMEYILRNSILSLLAYPGSTLLGIPRILADKAYRKKVVEKLDDPIVKSFWVTEYDQYQEKFRSEAISPIQNKIGQFLSSSLIRNILGQPKSSFDLREIMDGRKILLLNLAKGRVGEDNAALLGGMMITKLQTAAMSRVDIPEKERKDFFLYVDEFQNFATESFANILSEARKYRLNLIIAHQYIEQLDEQVQAAVFGNVGTIACFRVGAADAEFLAKEFAPVFDETDLINLKKYDIYLRLMIDGVASDPFSATTLPPVSGSTNNAAKVIGVSRERYANKREIVEEKIRRWTGVEEIHLGQARGSYPGDNAQRGTSREREREKEEPVPAPKLEELEPVVKETGAEISLSQAITMGKPQQAQQHQSPYQAPQNTERAQHAQQPLRRIEQTNNDRPAFSSSGDPQRRSRRRRRGGQSGGFSQPQGLHGGRSSPWQGPSSPSPQHHTSPPQTTPPKPTSPPGNVVRPGEEIRFD